MVLVPVEDEVGTVDVVLAELVEGLVEVEDEVVLEVDVVLVDVVEELVEVEEDEVVLEVDVVELVEDEEVLDETPVAAGPPTATTVFCRVT